MTLRYSFPGVGYGLGSDLALPACEQVAVARVTACSVAGYRAAGERHPEAGLGGRIPGSIPQQVRSLQSVVSGLQILPDSSVAR